MLIIAAFINIFVVFIWHHVSHWCTTLQIPDSEVKHQQYSGVKAIDRLLKYNKILTASKTIACQTEYDIGVHCNCWCQSLWFHFLCSWQTMLSKHLPVRISWRKNWKHWRRNFIASTWLMNFQNMLELNGRSTSWSQKFSYLVHQFNAFYYYIMIFVSVCYTAHFQDLSKTLKYGRMTDQKMFLLGQLKMFVNS